MKNIQKRENGIKAFIVSICLLLTGCGTIGLAQEATFESAYENKPEEEPIDIYTSQGYGVVQQIDTIEEEVTVYLLERREERTFGYSPATTVFDQHGSALTMQQIAPGEIVNVSYNNELEKVGSIRLSSQAWRYDGIEKYQMDAKKGTVTIGSDTFGLFKNVKIFSDNRQLEISQILKQDVLSFRGIGREVVSVVVEKGHGYLDLSEEAALLGGWIEVGQTVITEINEDMLITVPEGDYVVRVTADEIEEIREVTIRRDEETVLNFSNIEISKPTSARVSFDILPAAASVYIDDNEVDASYTIRLPFGIHKITASAPGYDTLSEYFEVTEEDTVVKMNLNEAEEEITVSGNEAEEDQQQDMVTIQGPVGVEVYQDNLYKGIAPVTYLKEPGEHVITLRKSGYITRSHSIYIADDEGDVTYTFSDLEPEEEKKEDDSEEESTVSDNTVSGNKDTSSDEKEEEKDKNDKGTITISMNSMVFS